MRRGTAPLPNERIREFAVAAKPETVCGSGSQLELVLSWKDVRQV
jgi:hypothetical protein